MSKQNNGTLADIFANAKGGNPLAEVVRQKAATSKAQVTQVEAPVVSAKAKKAYKGKGLAAPAPAHRDAPARVKVFEKDRRRPTAVEAAAKEADIALAWATYRQ